MAQKITNVASSKAKGLPSVTGTSATYEVLAKASQSDKTGLAENEKWLYENPEALASVKRGLADSAAGRVQERRSYAEYADIEIED